MRGNSFYVSSGVWIGARRRGNSFVREIGSSVDLASRARRLLDITMPVKTCLRDPVLFIRESSEHDKNDENDKIN